MHDLAVIIPAYKERYLHRALQSLADQTCKDFSVYIGDDCSPSDLKSIVDRFRGDLNIVYFRFDNNIGSENLVNQWKRCIEMCKSEAWMWLFSDDDIADSNCVENFFAIKRAYRGKYDVYRFNTSIIDGNGALLQETPIGPMEETSESMAYHLLLGERGNSMPDHIFSRRVYVDKGGIVFTKYAQGADWATSILFSTEKGIAIIPNSKVYWRFSGLNISGSASTGGRKMIHGHLQFLKWILDHFAYLKNSSSDITYEMIKTGVKMNVKNVFINHFKGVGLVSGLSLTYFLLFNLHLSVKETFTALHTIDIHTGNSLAWAGRIKLVIKAAFNRM